MAGGNAFRPRDADAVAAFEGDGAPDDRRWFADEVVIDFPSVAPAVERMRIAFLAEERCETVPAEVQLTRREAQEGVTVRLGVPVRSTCQACGGRGGTWANACSTCSGLGIELLEQRIRITVPPGVADGACFHFSIAAHLDISTRIALRVFVH